jgi:hypothetical protein
VYIIFSLYYRVFYLPYKPTWVFVIRTYRNDVTRLARNYISFLIIFLWFRRSNRKGLRSAPLLGPLSSFGTTSLLRRAQRELLRLCSFLWRVHTGGFLQHLHALGGTAAAAITITIVILRLVLASTHAPISRKAPKRTSALRLLLHKDISMCLGLRARPRATPTPAEEREARVGTVVREDPRAELRVVRSADDVRCRAVNKLHLLFVWLKKMLRFSIFLFTI